MKKTVFLIALVLAAQVIWAVDESYYSSLNDKKDGVLRTAITSLVYTHHTTALGYNWNFADMDIVGNEVLDMYSTCSWTETTDQCGNYSGVCGCYNREHTVPQSLFSERSPQVGDRHHLFLTDGKVNSVRSNYAFGETDETTTWNNVANGANALGQLGKASYAYASSVTVYEPDDDYKGDIARAIMYMAVRYATANECRAYNSGSGNEYPVTAWSSNEMFSGNLSVNYGLSDAAVQTFLKWHRADKVSAKEIARNTGVENAQHNRNPFVDYPILVEYLWGKYAGQNFEVSNAVGSFSSAFVPGVSDGDKAGSEIPEECMPPENYYACIEGMQDSLLKSTLGAYTFAQFTTRYSYGSGTNHTWQGLYYTDRNDQDNSVIDMYSSNKRYFNPNSPTASVTDCDIEHMFPNSWWGAEAGNKHAYCDLHHLVPADYSANRSKSNRGPGVPTDTTFNNGVWVNGRDANRANIEVFCPPDEYKGDFARAFFYIATTYGDTAVWQKEAVPNHMSNTDWQEFLPLTRDLLLEWHRQDPVSAKEVIRMNEVYKIQGNRNPFIDYPCLAEYIWGVHQGEAVHISTLVSGYEGIDTDCCGSGGEPELYTITWSVNGENSSSQVLEGQRPVAPSVDDCSASRVFVGWTTSNSFTGVPDPLYNGTLPAASQTTTYYAVYADKEIQGGTDGFAIYSGALTEGDYVLYYNGKAMKAAISNDRLHYEEVSPVNNKIATDEASIVWHIAQTNGSWTIYNAEMGAYAASKGVANKVQFLEADTTDMALWTVSGDATYEFVNKQNAANEVNANLRNNGTYGFSCYSKSTGGALSLYKGSLPTVVYSNYSTRCTNTVCTVTWKANGVTVASENVQPGGLYELPEDPADCDAGRVFMGWTVVKNYEDENIAPADLFTSALLAPVVTKDTTIYAVYADKETSSTVTEVTDTLNRDVTGVTGNSYTGWSGKSVTSDAVYAGNTAGGKSSIQMRSTDNSGIITTTSGGIAKRITVVWHESTDAARVLNIYASNTPYDTTANLYDSNKRGTLIASLPKKDTTLVINGTYAYIGIRSSSNALYLQEVAITWDAPNGGSETTYSNYSTRCGVGPVCVALAATDVTQNAFTANWTEAGVSSYSLDVTTAVEQPTQKDTTFVDKDFSQSLDGWTISNVSGYETVWTYSEQYKYVQATSYVNKERNEAESWLISPSIDLTKANSATLTLNNVFRYSTSVYLMIRVASSAEWNALAPTNWTAASSWEFVNSVADLSAYVGKTVVVGFQYVGTTTACPTWEIKRLTISGTTDAVELEHTSIDGYPQMVSGTSADVTGLTPATTYYYTVTPEGGDASNRIEVRTLESTDPSNVKNVNDAMPARKVLIGNQLFIVVGGELYDTTGKRVR